MIRVSTYITHHIFERINQMAKVAVLKLKCTIFCWRLHQIGCIHSMYLCKIYFMKIVFVCPNENGFAIVSQLCRKMYARYHIQALYFLHRLPDVRVGKLSPFKVFNCTELFGNVLRIRYGPNHTASNLPGKSNFGASWSNTIIPSLKV